MRCSNKIKFICEDEAVAVELISFLKKCSLNPSCTIPALASLVNSLKLEGCSLACEEGMFYDPEEATTVFKSCEADCIIIPECNSIIRSG